MVVDKKNIIVIVASCLFLMTACSDRKDSAEVVDARPPSAYHVVKKGETLDSICKKYHISKSDLIEVNHLKPPYKVFPKQRIKVKIDKLSSSQYYAQGEGLVVKNLPDEGNDSVSVMSSHVLNSNDPLHAGAEHNELKNTQTEDQSREGASISPLFTGDAVGISSQKETPSNFAPSQEFRQETSGRLPDGAFEWPVKGKVSHASAQKTLNIEAPAGTKIKAVAEGEVIRAGRIRELQELGNLVQIRHKDGLNSFYCFLKEVYVKKGQTIGRGIIIGTVGVNKANNKAMLGFRLRMKKDGKLVAVDPSQYFGS